MSDPIDATATPPCRVVVLASGRGSHFAALADAAADGALPITVAGLFSDRAQAAVLARAAERGIPFRVFAPRDFDGRDAHEAALFAAVDALSPDLIVCAGYMRILGADTVRSRSARMMNIHPSLLPRHRGLHTHRRALEDGDAEHGASVHFVTAELDGGPVLAQARIRIERDDDEASLAARVLAVEHPLLRACVQLYAAGRVALRGDAIEIDGRALRAPLQLDPASGRLAPA